MKFNDAQKYPFNICIENNKQQISLFFFQKVNRHIYKNIRGFQREQYLSIKDGVVKCEWFMALFNFELQLFILLGYLFS